MTIFFRVGIEIGYKICSWYSYKVPGDEGSLYKTFFVVGTVVVQYIMFCNGYITSLPVLCMLLNQCDWYIK